MGNNPEGSERKRYVVFLHLFRVSKFGSKNAKEVGIINEFYIRN